jgi:tetratricopeptide (TPR) repeat protein
VFLQRRISQISSGIPAMMPPPRPKPSASALRKIAMRPTYTREELEEVSDLILHYPENVELYQWRGFLRFQPNKWPPNKHELSLVEKDFDRAIEMQASVADIFYHRAVVRYYLDDIEGAVEDCSRALEIGFRSFNCIKGAVYFAKDVQKSRAIMRVKIGDYRGAAEDYSAVIELGDKSYHSRGKCFYNLNEYGLALDDFREAVQVTKIEHRRILDSFNTALELFTTENQEVPSMLWPHFRPSSEEAFLDYGYLQAELDDKDGAEATFRELIHHYSSISIPDLLDCEFENLKSYCATLGNQEGLKPYCHFVPLGYASAAIGETESAIRYFNFAAKAFQACGFDKIYDLVAAEIKDLKLRTHQL